MEENRGHESPNSELENATAMSSRWIERWRRRRRSSGERYRIFLVNFFALLNIFLAPFALFIEISNVRELHVAGHPNWSAFLLIVVLTSRLVVTVYAHFSHTRRYFNYVQAERDVKSENRPAFQLHWRESRVPPRTEMALSIFYFFGMGHVVPSYLSLLFKEDDGNNYVGRLFFSESKLTMEQRRFAFKTRLFYNLLSRFPLAIYYPYYMFSTGEMDFFLIISWISIVIQISVSSMDKYAIPLLDYASVFTRFLIRMSYCCYSYYSLFLSVPIVAFLMRCSKGGEENEIAVMLLTSVFTLFLRILIPRYFLNMKRRGAYLLWWLVILIVPNYLLSFEHERYASKFPQCSISVGNISFRSLPFLSYNSNFIFEIDNDSRVSFSSESSSSTLPLLYLSFIPAGMMLLIWLYEFCAYMIEMGKFMASISVFVKKLTLLSIFLYCFDLITDVWTGVQHEQRGANEMFSLTLLFVILPAVVNGIYGLCHYKRLGFFYGRNNKTAFIIFMHVTGLAQLLWTVDDFLCTYYGYDIGPNAFADNELRTSQMSTFELTTLFLEDLPQSFLQIYIIFHRGDDSSTTWIQTLGIICSMFSASKTLVVNGVKLFEKMFRLRINVVDEPNNTIEFDGSKVMLKPKVGVNYDKKDMNDPADHKVRMFSKKTFEYKYEFKNAQNSSSGSCSTLEIINKYFAFFLLIPMFINIFATITGVAYLCECGSGDGNRMVYVAFPVMIIFRVLFPSQLITPRWLKYVFSKCCSKAREALANWTVSLLVLALPFIIHSCMTLRSEECDFVAIGQTCLHHGRCYDGSTFDGFMVLMGVNSHFITLIVGMSLTVFWQLAFRYTKRECESLDGLDGLKKHVDECDCEAEELERALKVRINGKKPELDFDLSKDLRSLLRKNDMAKQFEFTTYLESSSIVKDACRLNDDDTVLNRLEILGNLFENGVPCTKNPLSFFEIKEKIVSSSNDTDASDADSDTSDVTSDDATLSAIEGLFQKGAEWTMGGERSIGKIEQRARELDLMYAMRPILANNPALIWFILEKNADAKERVKANYRESKTNRDKNLSSRSSSPAADDEDGVNFEERESQFIEELIVLVLFSILKRPNSSS